jgi:hypothetical protein
VTKSPINGNVTDFSQRLFGAHFCMMQLLCSNIAAVLLCLLPSALSQLTLPDDNPARRVLGGPLWDPRTYSPYDAASDSMSAASGSTESNDAQGRRHLQAGCGVYPNPVGLGSHFFLRVERSCATDLTICFCMHTNNRCHAVPCALG